MCVYQLVISLQSLSQHQTAPHGPQTWTGEDGCCFLNDARYSNYDLANYNPELLSRAHLVILQTDRQTEIQIFEESYHFLNAARLRNYDLANYNAELLSRPHLVILHTDRQTKTQI